MPKRYATAVLIAVVLSGTTLFPMPGAHALSTYEIQIGSYLTIPYGAESTRFFPSQLKVHTGDTLRFTTNGIHSATLLPTGTDPDEWVAANAANVGAPYSYITTDEDDGPRQLKFNPAAFEPSDETCGYEWTGPCDYDGTQVVNSGIPLLTTMDFAVTVSLPSGTTFWVVDVAVPTMRLSVEVVPGSEEASSQSVIEAERTDQLMADSERGQALHMRFSKPKSIRRHGKTIWKVFAGIERPGLSLRGFYPGKLKIKRGQQVRWKFSELVSERHSATFPRAFAATITANLPAIKCDPDGAGLGPDDGQQLLEPPFCEDAEHLELDIPAAVMKQTGDGVFRRRTDLSSSGARGADAMSRSGSYRLRFVKRSGKKGFRYACSLHPFMRGKVVVK